MVTGAVCGGLGMRAQPFFCETTRRFWLPYQENGTGHLYEQLLEVL